MNAENALEAFAAIAVGVAGFSAIVVALAANTVLYDSRRLTWAMGIIFGWSLGATLFAVLPFIFQSFGMPDSIMWQVSLLVMGSYTASVGAVVLYVDRRLNRMGVNMIGRQNDAPVKRSREMTIAKYVYILATVMLFAAGAWHPIPGYYLLGMTIMLMLSIWVLLFVFFVIGFRRKRADQ